MPAPRCDNGLHFTDSARVANQGRPCRRRLGYCRAGRFRCL